MYIYIYIYIKSFVFGLPAEMRGGLCFVLAFCPRPHVRPVGVVFLQDIDCTECPVAYKLRNALVSRILESLDSHARPLWLKQKPRS